MDTGIVAIAGKFPLTPESSASLPPTVAIGQHTVIPPRGCGMFVAAHELADADGGSYVLWAFAAHRDRLSAAAELSEVTSAGLRELVGLLISSWHPTGANTALRDAKLLSRGSLLSHGGPGPAGRGIAGVPHYHR